MLAIDNIMITCVNNKEYLKIEFLLKKCLQLKAYGVNLLTTASGSEVIILIIKIKSNEFKSLRIKKGFSQRGLGRAANLSSGLINQIENSERNPSPESAKKICDALNVEFDEIFFAVSACNSKHSEHVI